MKKLKNIRIYNAVYPSAFLTLFIQVICRAKMCSKYDNAKLIKQTSVSFQI